MAVLYKRKIAVPREQSNDKLFRFIRVGEQGGNRDYVLGYGRYEEVKQLKADRGA